MRNNYSFLKIRLFLNILSKGKLSFRKICNAALCFGTYILRIPTSAKYPYILSLELGNDCNIACLFCRDEKGTIHNYNTKKPEATIAKGKMPVEMASDIISQVKDDICVAVLYTNGEPLLYHDLPKVIRHATQNKVATTIASNGLLLNDRIAKEILEAGLDLIKIQLSGFTNDIYRIQTRFGDIEKLKANIKRLVELNRAGKHKTIILVDYILYKYNAHQLEFVRNFCKEIGVLMNVRPGNPKGGLEDQETPLHQDKLPLKESCSWIWQGMQINWNGDVLPCCEAVVWGDAKAYKKFEVGVTSVKEVWNSAPAVGMRKILGKSDGRGTIDMCSKCLRKGLCFKW